jgi:hypothetical protein
MIIIRINRSRRVNLVSARGGICNQPKQFYCLLGWDMPPFSSSVGERKLMEHFVVSRVYP